MALSAAAGVSEEEWAAAVRLGAAGSAAKAFLFNHPPHSPAIAVAAAAAAGSPQGPVPAPHGRYIQLQEPKNRREQQRDHQVQQQADASGDEAARASKGSLSAGTHHMARDALAAVAAAANATSNSRQQQQVTRGPTPIVRYAQPLKSTVLIALMWLILNCLGATRLAVLVSTLGLAVCGRKLLCIIN